MLLKKGHFVFQKTPSQNKFFHPIEIFFQTFYLSIAILFFYYSSYRNIFQTFHPMAILFSTFPCIEIFFQTFYPVAIVFSLFILWHGSQK